MFIYTFVLLGVFVLGYVYYETTVLRTHSVTNVSTINMFDLWLRPRGMKFEYNTVSASEVFLFDSARIRTVSIIKDPFGNRRGY